MNCWENRGGGMSRVHVFDPRLNAGSYMLKEQYGFNDSQLAVTLHFDNQSENDLTFYLGGESPAKDFVYANLKGSKKVFSVVKQWKEVFGKFLSQRPYLIFLNLPLCFYMFYLILS